MLTAFDNISPDMPESLVAILVAPLLAFAVQILLGRRLSMFKAGGAVSIAAVALSLGLSLKVFFGMLGGGGVDFHQTFTWFTLRGGGEPIPIEMGILCDNLTAIMLVVVTGVSFLVHLYSVGYMHGDLRYSRYFGYLSIFTFSMLGLVLSDNFFSLFIFWELVGLSSYLLIGFWFEKKSAADACKKAFVVNRVGDTGFLVGLMLLLAFAGVFEFGAVERWASGAGNTALLTTIGLCLFCGAVGKSAQFPLHVWLPDAMEGPTPVSALIHAATMVAAGVYLVARMFPVLTVDAMNVIAVVGVGTAFLAATIAVAQTDIKKVLAYSTISQLGYMITALGVGGYVSGVLHLVTHAAFKACLFLGSGSVIHAVHTQEMPEMGGLRRKMPITFATFLVATLAIAGIPLFSGHLSKDMILVDTLAFAKDRGGASWGIPLLALGTAGLTAFYMFRLVFMTFCGPARDRHKYDHAHESPWQMTVPLVILAALSFQFVFTFPLPGGHGFVGDTGGGHAEGWFASLVTAPESFVDYVRVDQETHEWAHHQASMLVMPLVLAGIAAAAYAYLWKRGVPLRAAAALPGVHRFLKNKWYFDELYEALLVKGCKGLCRLLRSFDLTVIDGIVNGVARRTAEIAFGTGKVDDAVVDATVVGTARFTYGTGQLLRMLQTGRLQAYLFGLLGGVVLLLLVRL
jgi:NADH-quinone oxidoreductase subunit L